MVKQLAFSAADHARIAEAIRAAERHTSGEIFAVFARASDGYFFVSGFFALVLSMGVALLVAIGLTIADVALPPLALETAEVASAVLLLILLRLSAPFRMLFVPAAIRHERASRLARLQFLAHNLHATEQRTGILIFVSEAEHYAEVIADSGISARVPQDAWNGIVAALTAAAAQDRLPDGYCEAIATAGALLAQHFPVDERDTNELPDRLVEI
ncbi:TPM domain-containing protein [Mangrovicella endophytica]|uniref:TPM domain-containing protein n=1 Tax=Mangrovicella endophytica TaxID=2066697 RepID=UPI000C9E164E|nr:hypothetical protein [Mangrovicella endophytica]